MLDNQRRRIDQIDEEIVKLFEERMAVVKEVINIKLQHNMDILDSSREHLVIEKAIDRLKNKELIEEIKVFFTEMMRISREYQVKVKKAYDK